MCDTCNLAGDPGVVQPGVPVLDLQESRRAAAEGRPRQRDHGPAGGVAHDSEQFADQPLQHAVQEGHPGPGQESVGHERDPRELDAGAELVDLLGGCVCGRWHCQAAADGGEALQWHWQELAEDYGQGAWEHECCSVLYYWRDAEAVAPVFAGAVGALSEVSDRVCENYYLRWIWEDLVLLRFIH